MLHSDDLVREAAESIAILGKKLNIITAVTPLDFQAEKEAWLTQAAKGHLTNPLFVYNWSTLEKMAAAAEDFSADSQILSEFYLTEQSSQAKDLLVNHILANRLRELSLAIQLVNGILSGNAESTTFASQQLFGLPSSNLIALASDRLFTLSEKNQLVAKESVDSTRNKRQLKGSYLSVNPGTDKLCPAGEIQHHFQESLDQYRVTDWSIKLDPNTSAIDVRDYQSTIVIPLSRSVTTGKLRELIGHEIECHLRGSLNSRAFLSNRLGKNHLLYPLVNLLAKSYNETFYEGVAKHSDVRVHAAIHHNDGSAQIPGPWYTLAALYATESDFADTAQQIYDVARTTGHYSEQQALKFAWNAAYRVKRGCSNTKYKGYVFTKDTAYLSGYHLVESLDPANRTAVSHYSSLRLDEAQLVIADRHAAPAFPNLDLALFGLL